MTRTQRNPHRTPTQAHLDLLEEAGFDLSPDPRNIRHLIESGWSTSEVAETYGVSTRTVQRWLVDPHPCPGERCLTMTPGGRLCAYCRRSEAMERAA